MKVLISEYELEGTELKFYKLDKRIKTPKHFKLNGLLRELDLEDYKGKKTDSKPLSIFKLIDYYKIRTKERIYFIDKKTMKEVYEERRN